MTMVRKCNLPCAGVGMQELPAALSGKNGDEWDVVVAHFLGLDHVGHSFDCGSPQMAAKARQLDQYMEHVRAPWGLLTTWMSGGCFEID
jgi:Type I phosphodiesterase / nucleotide pyrophosphatase